MRVLRLLMVLNCAVLGLNSFAQTLPSGGQWGCPAIPISSTFNRTCFQATSQILLGQGYFDHYGASDPVYVVIPQNKHHYALSIAIGWNYFKNIVGNNSLSINQFSATLAQENGFATFYNGSSVADRMPATIYDAPSGTTIALPCTYNRGCTNYSGAGATYQWHVGQNGSDGPYHFTLAGYQTANPYAPNRFPGPEATYHPLYNSNMPVATMCKTFYDLSIYRRAQGINSFDIGAIEASAVDKYGVDAALAVAYNLGPNAGSSIGSLGYSLSSAFTTSGFTAGSLFTGGVSGYAQRVSCFTAVLDSNKAYAVSNCGSTYGGNANNWRFYNYYDQLIAWDTVALTLQRLLLMYPTLNASTYLSTVKTKFDAIKGGAPLSFRYEFGPVLDEIVFNLPKDDPAATAANAINGTGCSLGCTAPYTKITPTSSTTICVGQNVIMNADVDGATSSTTYQWFRNGVAIPGATSMQLTTTLAGTYSITTCWDAVKTKAPSIGSTVKCCATPECKVDVTVLATCSSCAMGLSLTPTQNACTGMPSGSITAVPSGSGATGNLVYRWTGPSSGSVTTTGLTYTIPNLRDGKYTISVSQLLTPSCRAVQDVYIIPVSVIKESLSAVSTVGSCNTRLNAILINQKPNTCPVQVSYGSIGFSWDAAFFMSLRNNKTGILNMFEGYSIPWSPTAPNNPWTPPFPTGAAPNVKTITVSDGDTITAEGVIIVPLGTGVPSYYDGGIRLDNATFTDLSTLTNTTTYSWKYQGATPTPGLRQIGNKVTVTCPVASPPAYTYAWGPGTGLNNPSIQNPISSHNVNPNILYTVTATLVSNTNCKLTDTIYVARNCVSVLGVNLSELNADKQGRETLLTWKTIKEENFSHFIIEHSTDGLSFTALQTIKGANSRNGSNYSFTHKNPQLQNYYRLKMVDFDGSYAYSPVRSLAFDPMLEVLVQPNPFIGSTELVLNGLGQNPVEIVIISLQGNKVFETSTSNQTSLTIGADLASGVYILQVKDEAEIVTRKIVKE